jgi:hypothetical protein
MYQNIPTKVLTGECRASYCNLTAPRAAQQGGDPKYGVTLLIPKTDTATYQDIVNSIEAAAQAATGSLWNGVRPPVLESVIWDGDGVRKNGTAFGPECKGHWVVTASTKNKPQVVDLNGNDLLPQDIYSGMRVRATVNFFGYLNSGKKGVGCGLGNVQKLRDDEPLGGGASAEADFGITPAAPGYLAPAYPAQLQYAPPAVPAYGGVPAGTAPIPQTYGTTPGAINPLTGQPI